MSTKPFKLGNPSTNVAKILESNYNYSQFVVLPNGIVKLSGQGGWDDKFNINANDQHLQIDIAFQNLDLNLKAAGCKGLEDVYLIRTYSTHIENHDYLAECLGKHLPQKPIWTALSVPRLGHPLMCIEIEVEAWKGE